MKMTHNRTNKAHKRRQQGGMKLNHEVLQHFIDRGIEYNDLNVMNFLIANTNDIRIVWDASTYSFIFELTFPDGLIDPYGLDLADSAATFAAFTGASAAAAAGTPEPGTHVSTFCAKISFVHDGPSLIKEYNKIRKQTVSSDKATREARTQGMLFEEFACFRTTAPFVPDVIVHAILSGDQFRGIFGTVLSSTAPTKKIYDWLNAWIASDGIMVDVIFMEMMDLQRTAPGVPRNKQFKMIHSLRSHQAQHQLAALRMMAEIALVRGKGIMPHDFHEGNGLATEDGLQLYLIDWGGLFNLKIEADRRSVLSIFKKMCRQSYNTSAEASAQAKTKAAATNDYKEKRLARFPSLEELCGFFQIRFDPSAFDRDATIDELTHLFQEDLDGFVDFTCDAPTPQNVHKALMMVAFVDFMANRMNLNHPYCQCGNVLKVVYPDQDVTVPTTTGIDVTAFDDFRFFLRTFEVDSFPSHTRLPQVVAMITENVRLCPSACAPLPLSHLRASSWVNEEITKRAAARLEAERTRAEADRIRAEAERMRAEEAARLEAARLEAARLEAARLEAARLEAARLEAARLEAAKEAERLKNAKKMGVRKLPTSSKAKEVAKLQVHAQQVHAQQVHAQQQAPSAAASVADVAVSRSWLSKLNPKSWSLSLPAWLSKKKGGTRKQCKQRTQRKCFTKRRN
jgi:hypothetical protein